MTNKLNRYKNIKFFDRSIVKVNAGKEENVYRGRAKGETE